MFVYSPKNLLPKRIKEAESIISILPTRHALITGSFLFKRSYRDIDVFVISRTQKELTSANKKVKIAVLDFNNLHSLLYHSISKECVSKNALPIKSVKVTLADYWSVINEAVPELLNQKGNNKVIRSLILYTEYFRTGIILGTSELDAKLEEFKNHKQILNYIRAEVPAILNRLAEFSYLKRFFYTQSGFYITLSEYDAQRFLLNLAHDVIAYGRSSRVQNKGPKPVRTRTPN